MQFRAGFGEDRQDREERLEEARLRDELDEAVDDLEDKGIVESFIGEDGKVWYRLTPKGLEIGQRLADADPSREQE